MSTGKYTVPITTVFSINPTTGLPYCTVEYATNLIYKHITLKAQNLLKVHSIEDLKQALLMKLCTAAYKPELSAVNTFIIMCSTSQCARIWEVSFRIRDQHKETGDFVLFENEEGSPVMACDYIGIEYITPEDSLSAKETVRDFITNPPRYSNGVCKIKPTGWNTNKRKSK